MTIYYADGDEDDREPFCEAIHQVNDKIKVDLAFDGQHALGELTTRSKLPDFIFLDVNMSGMTGVQCLRENKSYSSIEANSCYLVYNNCGQKYAYNVHFERSSRLHCQAKFIHEVVAVLKQVFSNDNAPIQTSLGKTLSGNSILGWPILYQ